MALASLGPLPFVLTMIWTGPSRCTLPKKKSHSGGTSATLQGMRSATHCRWMAVDSVGESVATSTRAYGAGGNDVGAPLGDVDGESPGGSKSVGRYSRSMWSICLRAIR